MAAAREAGDAGFDALIACAFNYDAHSADFTKLGRIPVLKARMNADLHMADDLKNTGKGNLFVVFGEPDVEVVSGRTHTPIRPRPLRPAIQGAAEAGYEMLIIDSLTHAWAGEGGILEFVDRATQAVKNNFAAWREASPKHNQLVDAMLGAPLHIIATIRSKTAWDVQKDERTGKTRPVKIGLAPVQRDGLEYEFTTVLELSVDGHIATATKDRTGLFDGSYFTPGKATGERLMAWLTGESANGNGSDQPVNAQSKPTVVQIPPPSKPIPRTDSGTTVVDLYGVLRTLGLGDQVELYEMYLVKKYGHGSKDLTPGEISEQFITLSRCKRDAKMLKQLTGYFAALENFRKAA
ncbi:hypothetical protein JCM31598_15520 [Desulfonatronum parangueonense]